MKVEIGIENRVAQVELIEKLDNKIKVAVDGLVYEIDAIQVGKGVYSILIDHVSFNVELVEGENPKQFIVNTLYNSFTADIIDAEAKYAKSRNKGLGNDNANFISSPMPGKVVKILVNVGDLVKAGDAVIIISAMKMESEYKVQADRIVKEIKVKEGDTVDGHQPLITFEPLVEEAS
jgi:biotin carboxyl carrier protein